MNNGDEERILATVLRRYLHDKRFSRECVLSRIFVITDLICPFRTGKGELFNFDATGPVKESDVVFFPVALQDRVGSSLRMERRDPG